MSSLSRSPLVWTCGSPLVSLYRLGASTAMAVWHSPRAICAGMCVGFENSEIWVQWHGVNARKTMSSILLSGMDSRVNSRDPAIFPPRGETNIPPRGGGGVDGVVSRVDWTCSLVCTERGWTHLQRRAEPFFGELRAAVGIPLLRCAWLAWIRSSPETVETLLLLSCVVCLLGSVRNDGRLGLAEIRAI